ncbi:MAG: acetolactate synthase small subunit [Planctomycetia bacterium]|nr:acetolactate synthase small subunit [Planctomycetia bacterium]
MSQHVFYALVHNVPGVLSHISGMFSARGYNIKSLTVGETHRAELSRMTVVVDGDDHTMDQVRKQLEKIVTVVRAEDISERDYVERDLALIKVQADSVRRMEIHELVNIFRAKIVDVALDSIVIELSGKENKIDAFIELMRPFGILELARSGRIAMTRGN